MSDELDTKREAAVRGLEVLSMPAAEVRDIDPAEWLATQDGEMVGFVEVEGVRLKIAALTEGETQSLMKRSRRPDPQRPGDPPKLDSMSFRLGMIVESLNKANPDKPPITANLLAGKKTGVLTQIQDAIMTLSGYNKEQPSSSFFA